jgi:hypothetical protein
MAYCMADVRGATCPGAQRSAAATYMVPDFMCSAWIVYKTPQQDLCVRGTSSRGRFRGMLREACACVRAWGARAHRTYALGQPEDDLCGKPGPQAYCGSVPAQTHPSDKESTIVPASTFGPVLQVTDRR